MKILNAENYDPVSGDPFTFLTAQETCCMEELLKGGTYSDIAERLSLSPRTVEFYINNIKTKFLCDKKKELVILFQGKVK